MKFADSKIIDSFLMLLNTKPASLITNNAILKNAGLSKTTFYNNFIDRADVLKQFEIIINNEILHAFIQQYRKQQLTGLTSQQMIDIFIDVGLPILYAYRDRIKIIQQSTVKDVWTHSFNVRYIRLIKKAFPNNDADNTRLFVKLINSILFLWLNQLLPMDEASFRTLIKNSYQIKCSHLFDRNQYYRLLRSNLSEA